MVVSASFGPISRENLGVVAPFWFKESDQEASVASFAITEKVLSCAFLKSMLENYELLPDFKVETIFKLFEYSLPTPGEPPPFETTMKKVLQVMKDCGKADTQFVQITKDSLNSFVGNLNFQISNYNRSLIASSDDLMSFNQLKNLVSGERVTDHHVLLHFKNPGRIKNAGHVSYDVILQGRTLMLNFLFKVHSLTTLQCVRSNTDNFVLASTEKS